MIVRSLSANAGSPPRQLSLAWLLWSSIGAAIAGTIVVGALVGRLGIVIEPIVLILGAATSVLLRLISLPLRRLETRPPVLLLTLLGFVAIAGLGLALAWPTLLPLGRSVDAVHQYQLVHWIATERHLPPVDGETRGRLGEMVAYPPGLAFVVVAATTVLHQPLLEGMYPTVAVLGGICAALLLILTTEASGVRGWRLVLPGLAGVLLLVAHRTYFLEAYIDHSYYAMVLGLLLVLLACSWPLCEGFSLASAPQLGLVLAALLVSYPLWLPVPVLVTLLALMLVARTHTLRWKLTWAAFVFAPIAFLAVFELPARLSTGQTVLEHEGVVTLPTLFNLAPALLAIPALLIIVVCGRPAWQRWLFLVAAICVALLQMAALALAAQQGAIAAYHSYKMLFVLIPLSAALVAASIMRLAMFSSAVWRRLALAATMLVLVATSIRFVLPFQVVQIPSADLVKAARWLEQNDPIAANRAILVGAPAGVVSYWLQVALLDQRRDQAEAAVRAFSETPPTPEGWAIDRTMPSTVIALDLDQPPPASEIAMRFGRVAVLRRAPLDPQVVNPLVIRYSTRWEEQRLKTSFELLHPAGGPLPLLELQVLQDDKVINSFQLQPNSERTKPQYLGADLLPATLGGEGYINSEAFPTFAPPSAAPSGALSLKLRLSLDGIALDERLLATFDRTSDGHFANISFHSGELDYLRHTPQTIDLQPTDVRFRDGLHLTGWRSDSGPPRTLNFNLRWNTERAIPRPLETELRLLDPSGKVIATNRSAPQHGFYPVWRWRAGETVVEQRTIALPDDLPSGEYTLTVGVFDSAAQRDVPVQNGSTALGKLQIGP